MRFTKPHTGGYKLPELNNPAGSNQIAAGFDAINNNGFVVTGVHECDGGVILPELTNPAGPDDIEKGKEAVDENGNIIKGTHECETLEDMTADGTAGPEDIAKDKTAYVNGVKITGTHECEKPATFETMEVDDDMIDLTGYKFHHKDSSGNYISGMDAAKEYLIIVAHDYGAEDTTNHSKVISLELYDSYSKDDEGEIETSDCGSIGIANNKMVGIKVTGVVAVKAGGKGSDNAKVYPSVCVYEKLA